MEIVLLVFVWIAVVVLFILILSGASLGKTSEDCYQEDEQQMRDLSKKNRNS